MCSGNGCSEVKRDLILKTLYQKAVPWTQYFVNALTNAFMAIVSQLDGSEQLEDVITFKDQLCKVYHKCSYPIVPF